MSQNKVRSSLARTKRKIESEERSASKISEFPSSLPSKIDIVFKERASLLTTLP